jgi:hypothetical protein
MDWGEDALKPDEITGKDVLEVGSKEEGGTWAHIINPMEPKLYVRSDMRPGMGVEKVMNAEDAVDVYGPESFDVVFGTEMLEHVEKWAEAVTAMKEVTRSGGFVLLTAPRPGQRKHAYPDDYWRFSIATFKKVFADWDIIELREDQKTTFVKARKPLRPAEPVEIQTDWAIPVDETAVEKKK